MTLYSEFIPSWRYLLFRLSRKSFVFVVVFFIIYGFYSGVQVAIATSDTYVPSPNLNVPAPLKKVFYLAVEDGEDKVTPIKNDGIVFHGPRDNKKVALTFDADMTPWMKAHYTSGAVSSYYDAKLIEELKQSHTKATLFLTGMWIELYPQIARELAANPLFELGNHSYSHPSFSGYCYGLAQMNPTNKDEEIEKTQRLLFDLTKKKNTLFRFPGGCYGQEDISLLREKDITGIQWDVVGDDGFNANFDAIVHNVVNNVHSGSIIVMHMNGAPNDPKTSEAVVTIVQNLKQQGYMFVTVSELLAPPMQKQALSIRTLYSFGDLL